ncbi:hypothetical protein ACFV4N_27865 [Actinosynnema sp. NPDC059797]
MSLPSTNDVATNPEAASGAVSDVPDRLEPMAEHIRQRASKIAEPGCRSGRGAAA